MEKGPLDEEPQVPAVRGEGPLRRGSKCRVDACPGAAVTNDHNVRGLEQQGVEVGQKTGGLLGLESGCQQGWVPWRLRGRVFSGLFLLLEGPLSLACGPSSIFTVNSNQFSLSSGSSALSFPFLGPFEDSGPIRRIQNNLFI